MAALATCARAIAPRPCLRRVRRWRSMWRCRRSARPAASRSAATACAPSCWSKLSLIAPPYCERLGIPFAYDPGPGVLSMQAIADPPAYHRARAAVRYDEIARTLVHALKYGDRLDLAPTDGRWMARAGRELLDGRRCAGAGAAALAAAVGAALQPVGAAGEGDRARHAGVPVADNALKRVKATPQQVGLSQTRARQQRAGRVPRAAGRQGRGRRPPADPDRRRAHLRRNGWMPARAPCCGRGSAASTCWCSPGLSTRCERPYSCDGESGAAFVASMSQIEIYTTPYCPYCIARKSF